MAVEKDHSKELRHHRYQPTEPIKVSVAMIAYNVGKYLEEAIESVLGQRTNFRLELVIGEDCSTDNTRSIALSYQAKYPEIVRVLLPEKNQGLTPNSVATQNACKGEYIAILDGDDYWTDASKLQKQADLLDKDAALSAVAHQAQIIFDDIEGEDSYFGATEPHRYTLKDTLQHRKFHTSSLVYRRSLWMRSGGIPASILSNERAIYPMLAYYGPIAYLPDVMCIYRRSSIGVSARVTTKALETDLNMIAWLKSLGPGFPAGKYRSFLHFSTYTYAVKVELWPLLKHYFLFVFFSFSYFPSNLGDVKHGTKEFFRLLRRDVLRR
jgi:glycosyltransferase involved in cell wall biosynthesis